MDSAISRIFFFLFFISCSAFSETNFKKLIILGDSLTEGYGVAQSEAFPALLQKKADDDKLNLKIISSGSSGSTSASGLDRIKWIAKSKPDAVLLLLGSNDGLRGIKVADTEKNLSATIEWAQKNNIRIALGQLLVPPNYGDDYEKNFSSMYPRIAKKYHVELAPFLLDHVAGVKDLNQADGIHPNEKGSKVVANNLYPFIKKLMSK